MKILLIDIDSKIPNLALKKIEKYHIDKGDEVVWNFPLYRQKADKVYVSCVFTKNSNRCFDYEDDPKCLIGGSGYDLSIKLPEEIGVIKPHINLGFTTRGCIRKCDFCIVPKKEGKIRIEADIYDLWDGKSKKIILLDNNILALPRHFETICNQLTKEGLKVDFNQGLDHRLLTPVICKKLLSLKHLQEIRFAFDHINYKPKVLKALKMLKECGLKDWRSRWYVYIGIKDTFETVFERLMILKEHHQCAYIMRDASIYYKTEYI
ncbi:MAG: hypothetical protein ACYC0D_07845, partial [Candidatus Humimicrobiaceae bacterium]